MKKENVIDNDTFGSIHLSHIAIRDYIYERNKRAFH